MLQSSGNWKRSPPLGFGARLLHWLYQVARLLSLLTGRLQREQLQLAPLASGVLRILLIAWRCLMVFIYWGIAPHIYKQYQHSPYSYGELFAQLQTTSVSLLPVASFILQARSERKFMDIVNRYLMLYRRIAEHTRAVPLLPRKFLILYGLKFVFTLCGCVDELPPLLEVQHLWSRGRMFAVGIGIYMWLGTLFVLDACFLGFLFLGIMYDQMGTHIKRLLHRMLPIESWQDARTGQRMSRYKRMQLLCDYADELDACNVIYSELHDLVVCFRKIFQWQILFYIYYNFGTILLMLYDVLWKYLNSDDMGIVALLLVCIKLANLVLLIMCADNVVQKSHLPERLPLDVVCTDIDHRWDKSVETFLSRQKMQQLEIKVLGFFQLNNEFILLILSAIISYLFILIQFGLTGGFEESELINHNLTQNHTNYSGNNNNSWLKIQTRASM